MHLLRLLWIALLLPGLLANGARAHVCLHALLGGLEDCAACAPETPSCCGGAESDDPSASGGEDCSSCCIDLEGAPRTAVAKERTGDAVPSALALPPHLPVARLVAAPVRGVPCRIPQRARPSPSAPGILPLRL